MNIPGYESLARVLHRAYDQAAQGKGAKRHACSRPFTEQPMQSISELLGSETGLLYQAMKKIQESQRMDQDAAIRELLGAINYIAGAIIFKEGKQGELPFARSSALKTEWENEQALQTMLPVMAQAVAGRAKATAASFDKKTSGDWTCRHGNDATLPSIVPVGAACPICFATSN